MSPDPELDGLTATEHAALSGGEVEEPLVGVLPWVHPTNSEADSGASTGSETDLWTTPETVKISAG